MIIPEDSIDHAVRRWEAEIPALDFSSLHIVSRMLQIVRIFERSRKDILDAANLEPWSFDTLAIVRRSEGGTTTPGELSRHTLVSLGTMTTRLKSLEHRKWITRRPSEHDRRVINVALTKNGRDRLDSTISEVLECQRCIIASVPVEQEFNLQASLRSILAPLEAPND